MVTNIKSYLPPQPPSKGVKFLPKFSSCFPPSCFSHPVRRRRAHSLEKTTAPRTARGPRRCTESASIMWHCALNTAQPLGLQPSRQPRAERQPLQPQPCAGPTIEDPHHLRVPLHGSRKRRFINRFLSPITEVTPWLLCNWRNMPPRPSSHLPAAGATVSKTI